jgi:hypothetical protein
MSDFTLTIETGNAAFGPSPAERAAELARILRAMADRMERHENILSSGAPVRDLNGNTVGRWHLSDFDYAAHGETDPDEEEADAPSVDAWEVKEITCTYGGSKTPANCYTWGDRSGTWYAVEGSTNVNHTPDDMPQGVDVEELADDDTGTAAAPINSAEDMAKFCSDI